MSIAFMIGAGLMKQAAESERGKRDGTGPFKDSYRRTKGKKGRRAEAGEECPEKKAASDPVADRLTLRREAMGSPLLHALMWGVPGAATGGGLGTLLGAGLGGREHGGEGAAVGGALGTLGGGLLGAYLGGNRRHRRNMNVERILSQLPAVQEQ